MNGSQFRVLLIGYTRTGQFLLQSAGKTRRKMFKSSIVDAVVVYRGLISERKSSKSIICKTYGNLTAVEICFDDQ